MTQPTDDLRQRVHGRDFKLYAEFGRERFGLLWVIQAVLLAIQTVVMLSPMAEAQPRWLAPALTLPTYLAYLIFRERLWLLLYRRQGHLRLVTDARTRRNELLRAAVGIAWIYYIQFRSYPLSVLGMAAAWAGAICGLQLLWGRVPGDGLIVGLTALLVANSITGLLYEPSMAHWWRTIGYFIFALYAARGIYEHYQFIGAARLLQPTDPPQEVNPSDTAR